MVLVTGIAGFIGAKFVMDWLVQSSDVVTSLDGLTTRPDKRENLSSLTGDKRHLFAQSDISNFTQVARLLARPPLLPINGFAAERHVNRSICGLEDFIQTDGRAYGLYL